MSKTTMYECPANAIYLLMLKVNGKLLTFKKDEEKFTLYFRAKNDFGIPGDYKIYLKPMEKYQQNHHFMPIPGAYTSVKS